MKRLFFLCSGGHELLNYLNRSIVEFSFAVPLFPWTVRGMFSYISSDLPIRMGAASAQCTDIP